MGVRLRRTGASSLVGFLIVMCLGLSALTALASSPVGGVGAAYPGTTATTVTTPPPTTTTTVGSTGTTVPGATTTTAKAGTTTTTQFITSYGVQIPTGPTLAGEQHVGPLPFTGASVFVMILIAAIALDVGILMIGLGRPRRRVRRI